MTTRRVVADAVLGQLARRQADLFRRVADGSLDSDDVLRRLQLMIEGVPDIFPVEKVPLTFSDRTYRVEVGAAPMGAVLDAWPYLWDFECRRDLEKFLERQGEQPRQTVALRLARVPSSTPKTDVLHYLQQANVEPATAWEALAFAQIAPFMKTRPATQYLIHAFGSVGYIQYPDGSGTNTERCVVLESRVADPSFPQNGGWYVKLWYLKIKPYAYVEPKDYILVRA
jgi:hypothetical protein